MTWGTSIWGTHSWAGGPSGDNLSFEDADTAGVQGKPDQWVIDSDSEQEMTATMEDDGLVWDPWEDLEEQWRAPFLVHLVEDLVNAVTSPDATDLSTALTLINELGPKYAAHLIFLDVHGTLDLDNLANLPPATDYDTAALSVMLLKLVFNQHIMAWSEVHRKWDILNTVTASDIDIGPPNPVELPDLLILVNQLKAKFNGHIVLQGYGDFNDVALFEFLASHLAGGVFQPDLTAESYERAWSILEVLPDDAERDLQVTVDGPGSWYIVVDSIPGDGDQFFLFDGALVLIFEFDTGGGVSDGAVAVDISLAGTVAQVAAEMINAITNTDLGFHVDNPLPAEILLVLVSGARMTAEMVDKATSADHLVATLAINRWPGGHEEFKSVFEYIVTELGIREKFEDVWYLPGTTAYPPNSVFAAKYLTTGDGGEPIWRFLTNHVVAGIVETFESSWRNNEIGLARYWSGTEWRYLDEHLHEFAIGSYTFGSFDLPTGAEVANPAITPHHSPALALHVTAAFLDAGQFWMEFYDKNGAVQSCYWHLDDDDKSADGVVEDIGLTSITDDPRYAFADQFAGIRQIKDQSKNFATPVGAMEIRGTRYLAETFEEGWILTL